MVMELAGCGWVANVYDLVVDWIRTRAGATLRGCQR